MRRPRTKAHAGIGYYVLTIVAVTLSLVSCGDEPVGPGEIDEPEPIILQYIQRLPEMDYVWASDDPAREGWPAVGEEVTWRVHLENWNDESLTAEYHWLLDGTVESQGTVTLPGGAEETLDFDWTWTFDRHELEFVLDPDNLLAEVPDENNTLHLYTDAISVGLYVEQSLYDFFRENQHRLEGVTSNSWEDWAQRHMTYMNQLFEDAIYPDTPNGVLDRVRLDRIHVVPDGSVDSYQHPNDADRSVDLVWGFKAEQIDWYNDLVHAQDYNNFYLNRSLVHELCHARYLIDTYAMSVSHYPEGGMIVDILEEGATVVDSKYMPVLAWINGVEARLHEPEQIGLMNQQYEVMDPYSAAALNLIAGHRATVGNYNEPENHGSFMNDLPAENRISIRDQAGNQLPNAEVEIYRSPVFPDPIGQRLWKQYDDVPDMSVTADGSGAILAGRNPFGGDEPIDRTNWSNTVIIIRVEHEGRVGYGFQESLPFNMEYWRGNTELGNYELTVTMHDQGI